MAAAGMYSIGGSFWEFGEPDWERTKLFLMFGVAEDHDSNPIKLALSGLRRRGAKFISINPVRTGYSAIADEWSGIRPGTDGLFVLSLVHELLRADKVDLDYLGRYTNAAWLVIQAPGSADDGLFARNEAGEPLVLDSAGGLTSGLKPGGEARVVGEAQLPDGRRAVPVFQLIAERYLDPRYAPEAVAPVCGIPAETIRRVAGEIAATAFGQEIEIPVAWTDWAGRQHSSMRGRPVSFHAMRGISAHSNGFQTCRALHLLQILLGTIDVPGGWRYKSPYPKPAPPGPKPAGKPGQVAPGTPLAGAPLGYVMSPEDLIVELGARLGLPAFVTPDGAPRYPGGYKDYIALHERTPGIGPLAGWRGADGDAQGKGAPNPKQLDRYIANGCFWKYELPPEQLYFKHANKAYLEGATAMGLIPAPEPIVLQLYVEPLQRFRLAAQGHGPAQPPEKDRARIATYFDPLPFWYAPFEETRADPGGFALHAITQRPMQMYHSWHSQNAWLRQILGQNRLFINRVTARGLGLAEDDWVWVSSHAGRIEGQVKLMDGVNPDTVWTWNAIGKRAGAWNLSADSPEFAKGFLLNHLITELLPPKDGDSAANADPITGQAAWYDLRVRIEKAPPAEAGRSAPAFPRLHHPPSLEPTPAILRYGAVPQDEYRP